MTPISERLRFRAEVKGNGDLAVGRRPPTYGKESELEWKAADTIDALVAALEAASADLEAVGRTDTFEQIDAALALARKGG